MTKITGTNGNNTLNRPDSDDVTEGRGGNDIHTRAEGELELAGKALVREVVNRNLDRQQ